jgi:superfamily II DNA or RNA helicase
VRKKTHKAQKIVLLKSGTRLAVSPTTPEIYDLLSPQLTFTNKEMLVGYEAKLAAEAGQSKVRLTDVECFDEDGKGRLITSYGFWKRIKTTLTHAGYEVRVRDLNPHPNPDVFEPRWERLKDFELRNGQDEFLLQLLSNPCGRFDCAPGFGKTFMIGLVALLLPKAKFDIVTKRVAVARERIYPELCQMLPDVGLIGGGRNQPGRRVMVYSAGSYHKTPGDADILIGDECHELVCDSLAHKLGLSTDSRNYGLSATHDMRWDGKDLRAEGIFGPILYTKSYQEAEADKMVVPIQVIWRPVVMNTDPCENYEDIEQKRHGIWRNEYRNSLIAKDANLYPAGEQVLITVETISHAVNLKRLLPDFTLVYNENGLDPADRRRYIKAGLLSADEPVMTADRRLELQQAFEQGRLKKVIATTVWNVGVDFTHLRVLIRADGGSSPINDLQIPGRTSRTRDGKGTSTIHDYVDHFNKGFKTRSRKRQKNYESYGWEQVFPQGSGSSFQGNFQAELDWNEKP